VTFNYRGNPLVQHARAMIVNGEIGRASSTAKYLQTGCCRRPILLAPRAEKGGASSAIGDIGSHWCDLVQHVVGQRIVEVLADLTTVIETRMKPAGSTEAFARSEGAREPFTVRSEDLASVLVRFDGGAKGSFSVGQVCAGHKNDLWFEADGRKAALRWYQERQNELWIGRREGPNCVLLKDPSLVNDAALPYTHLPAVIRKRGRTRSVT
jgi:predicted dehydrogenase